MDDLRRPCTHRGTAEVMTSQVEVAKGSVELNICTQCRRFWLERDGWLLSKRETMSILRDWPLHEMPLAR